MNKRLSRYDYLFAITFIFMLVVALGTFFYGFRMGQERATAKYEDVLFKKTEAENGYSAYHQQYLVSYYHTIYQPYREFHKKWFEKMNELEVNRSADASAILKDLAQLSKDKYTELSTKSMPDSSPLLQDGLQNYLKSLKLFGEALGTIQGKANSLPSYDLVAEMDKDAYLAEAKKFSLTAQKNYYDSIIKWNLADNPQLKQVDVSKPLTTQEWSTLSLSMKNDYIANSTLAGVIFKLYTPQDFASRIDDMITTGQAQKLSLSNVQQVMDLLMATDAVRSGDFIRNKSRLYPDEILPQLPFFFMQN
ncbi:hypothetical protein [Paenibacillus agricola]|uniref:Uncharacterized protein n=1 Tax=Paenibacillus agricola TaxID=2716264 RepID=A0ABX0J000_9BACL|nr:hypothetical protein [Paenibacillus agricola]NHN28756.1 hypothetical protein [Paenibacillus agricola]